MAGSACHSGLLMHVILKRHGGIRGGNDRSRHLRLN